LSIQSETNAPASPFRASTAAEILRETLAQAETRGFADGERGPAPRDVHDGIKELAAGAWDLSMCSLAGEAAAAKNAQMREEAMCEQARSREERYEKALAGHEEIRGQLPGRYSLTIGITLIVAALLLMFSDIPLSLSLVASGLRMPARARLIDTGGDGQKGEKTATGDSFVRENFRKQTAADTRQWETDTANGRVLNVTDLLRAPLTTIRLFWDTYALAIGLALLGIALKPLLDLLFDAPEGERRNRWVATGLVTVALILFLGTTVTLGYFRGQVFTGDAIASLQAEKDRLQIAAVATGKPAPRESIEEIDARIKQERENNLPTWAFIALTISLPLIGAVCFFFGCQRLDRYLVVRRLVRGRAAAQKQLEEAAAKTDSARAHHARLDMILQRRQIADARASFIAQCVGTYQTSFLDGQAAAMRSDSPTLFGKLRHACYYDLAQKRLRGGGGRP
jgi:hypothetical protein